MQEHLTDKDLLELAAKAVGPALWYSLPWDVMLDRSKGNRQWRPLEDDGDALRLAVKLNIQVTPRTDGKSQAAYNYIFVEDNGADPCAATRRAIVRAAAAIGQSR